MAEIKLEDFERDLAEAVKLFSPKKINKITFPILKFYEGESKYRIFNEGLASDGSKIGNYRSLSYKRAREARGRQTSYKDLEFEGDLRRSLTVGTNGNEFVFGFATDKSRLIGEYQEAQTGKEIFEPTNSEIKDINKLLAKEIEKCLKTAF